MRNLLFVSGARADYNKLSKIINYLSKTNKITVLLVDMHNDKRFGDTGRVVIESVKDNPNISVDRIGRKDTRDTIKYYSWLTAKLDIYYKKKNYDMVFIHGDRMAAMAGAIVASYNNIPVCHIEAGDVSGSIDQNIRYAITKFSHRFLVTNEDAKDRVLQVGERDDSVFNIGNTSVIGIDGKSGFSEELQQELGKNYAILMYHSVTTDTFENNRENFVFVTEAMKKFKGKVLLIESNNDKYYSSIQEIYETLPKDKFIIKKNLKPDNFYSVLLGSKFLIGNSSAGICEAPYLGVYSINIGNRQSGRVYKEKCDTIFHLEEKSDKLVETIENVSSLKKPKSKIRTVEEFEKVLSKVFTDDFFNIEINKKFIMR
ncbi:MAG: UDP-N-acetylglucosamine 2-epimerase (hydrolyzing) [Clostridiales bacterium]|nr:UDP-N-acetylglucosamine 2-epimerase (hydrolyzing) [Clostridiales bacterium]